MNDQEGETAMTGMVGRRGTEVEVGREDVKEGSHQTVSRGLRRLVPFRTQMC